MIVSELITLLQKMPQEMLVVVDATFYGGWGRIEAVTVKGDVPGLDGEAVFIG